MLRIHSMLKIFIYLLIGAALLLIPFENKVNAHAYSAGYTTLNLTKTSVEMTFSLDELSVIELIGGDINKNGMLEQDEFIAVKESYIELLKKNVILQINNTPQNWTQVESFTLDRKGDTAKAVLKVAYPPAAALQPISISDKLYEKAGDANYVDLLTVIYGKEKSTAALSGKYREWSMQLTENDYAGLKQDMQSQLPVDHGQAEDSESGVSGKSEHISGWYSFFTLGIGHILGGYDHLLFLFSLLIARQKFKQYAAMITAFTIAHSITLTLTVVGIIDVSPMFVESMIALSICFVAVENIVRKQVSYRWVLTFLFGLIHGMGFADILKEMDLPKSELATDLISFNLGIETVQVTLVAILLPLLGLLHHWKFSRRAVIAGSSLAFVLGAIWLSQRLFLA